MSRKTKTSAVSAAGPPSPAADFARPGFFSRNRYDVLACLLLVVGAWVLFSQVSAFSFLSQGDTEAVTANPMVNEGLTGKGVRLVLLESRVGAWRPLTWISRMADVERAGIDPAAHHNTNLLLHALNTGLVFLFFRLLTGSLARSVAVALLFAVHPLRAQSVAWVAERQGPLAAFFSLGGMSVWLRYLSTRSLWAYAAATLLLIAGVMASPAAAVVPLLLLLPWLRRETPIAPGELIPLLGIPVAAVAIWFARRGASSLDAVSDPFLPALVNTFWPLSLSPMGTGAGEGLQWLGPLLAAVLLTGALVWRRRAPYLLAGIVWFVAALGSSLLLAEITRHSYADRFTYFAHIGLLLALVWGAADLLGSKLRHPAAMVAGAALAAVLAWQCYVQTSYYRDDATLAAHSVATAPQSSEAHAALGAVLLAQGRAAEARIRFEEAVKLRPRDPLSYLNVAETYFREGKHEDALKQIARAIEVDPRSGRAYSNRGLVLRDAGRNEEALEAFRKALELGLAPELKQQALLNLGILENRFNRLPEALRYFQLALDEDPRLYLARKNLAFTYFKMRRFAEAQREFEKLYDDDPSDEDVQRAIRHLRNQGK